MYTNFFTSEKIKYSILSEDKTTEGINKVTLKLTGKGDHFLKLLNEGGNHRFVRKSPYSKQNKLHTSFVAVSISLFQEKKNIQVKDSDIKISFFKGSGAGGQHRNKVETGVRLVHVPTGIISEAVSERSQKQNREIAYNKLIERINNLNQEKQDDNKKTSWANKSNNGFGEKRRTYKLDISLVKDEMTGQQFNNLNKILSGNISNILS